MVHTFLVYRALWCGGTHVDPSHASLCLAMQPFQTESDQSYNAFFCYSFQRTHTRVCTFKQTYVCKHRLCVPPLEQQLQQQEKGGQQPALAEATCYPAVAVGAGALQVS